ncbi:MAG TPA: SlyX family protein [Xanthomonadales bacterium]|nr:SlyX family protein [Xanthomonadales bacterium]
MSGQQPREESRLDELESRAAFQDDLIESLNGVVARQDRELADLARRVKELEAKLEGLAEAASLPGGPAGHEVPPHY